MNPLFYIIISTISISLIAFVGAFILFLREKLLEKILLVLVAFSAGSLMGGAFLHLIPEAIEEVPEEQILNLFLFLLFGFCIFFVLEQFIRWHHHHAKNHPEINPVRSNKNNRKAQRNQTSNGVKPFSYLILFSDGVHNFIDGVVIAASFIVSVPLGIVTTLAVALHEVPQEIGDFGVLVYGGFKKIKALLLNFLSASTVIFGGIIGFLISEKIGSSIVFLLPFAAGNFIYIACSDLIPEIKHKVSGRKALLHFLIFLTGIGLMTVIKILWH